MIGRPSLGRLWRGAACGLALLASALVASAARADEPAPPAPQAVSAASAPHQVLVMLRSPPAHARLDGAYGGGGYGDAARAQAQARVGERLARAHGLRVVTQWPMPTLGLDCVVLALPPEADVAASIAALQAHAEVAWAQPMNEFHAQGHADPLYALQPAAAQWHLDDLHGVATGRHVVVAVVDSGIDGRHPDLADAIATRANFVDGQDDVAETHGTAVAGLVAARADNGVGIVGVAPDARLLALRACWQTPAATRCNTLSLAKALNFAIEQRAAVINMSLSGPSDVLLGRLIDVALSHRQQVVAAVDATAVDGGFPASHPGVIAVADALAGAPPPGLADVWTAPAHDLPAPVPGGGWRMVSGTSFASAQVAGLLAVLTQARAEAGGGADAARTRLVRLPGGGIDACASLRAAGPAHGAGGCGVVFARGGADAPAGVAERDGVAANR